MSFPHSRPCLLSLSASSECLPSWKKGTGLKGLLPLPTNIYHTHYAQASLQHLRPEANEIEFSPVSPSLALQGRALGRRNNPRSL